MMNVQRFVCNMFQENCYVVNDDTDEAVIIDCGAFYDEERKAIVNYIRDNKLNVKHLIETHAHIDHNFGNDTIFDNFGLKPEVHSADEKLFNALRQQAMDFCGIDYTNNIPPVERYFGDNDSIIFGNHTFVALHTPGHTPGSVIFYCEEEDCAFSGDTLFRLSIGRTDFPGGSFDDIKESLHNVIAPLPAKTTVLTGHGEATTIGDEVKMNPYF